MLSSAVVIALCGVAAASGGKDGLQNPVDVSVAWIAPVPSSLTRADFGPCAVTLNFDALVGGNINCTGDAITTQFTGIEFDVPSGNCVVCANSTLAALIPNNSDPNVAFAQQNTNVCSADALPATITFTPPVTMVGTDFFTSLNSDFTIRGYDAANALVASSTSVGSNNGGFLSGFAGIDVATPVIVKVEILSRSFTNPQPFNFSVDDLIYQSCPTCALRAPLPPRAANAAVSSGGLCQ